MAADPGLEQLFMNTVKSIFVSLVLSLLALQQANAASKDEQINTILEQTGFNKLLQHVPDFAQAVLKQSSGALEPEMNSALSGAFSRTFAVESVQHDVLDVLNAQFDTRHAEAYLRQLQSPLYSKMAELERSTTNLANRDDIQAFISGLEKTPATETRSALVERLDQATRTTDFSVDMQTAFFKAIFVAVDPVMSADMRLGKEELEKMVDEVSTSLKEGLHNSTRLSYLYAFRNISDAELTQYIELCESEDYRWAIQLLGNAMISALNQAAQRAAVLMAQNTD
jgi:hypothetical protein